jgi:hypothetical protein
MTFHPKGLIVVGIFALVLLIAGDARLGIGAVLAYTVIDALTFLAPAVGGRNGRSRPANSGER